jgi:hypothetical protein
MVRMRQRRGEFAGVKTALGRETIEIQCLIGKTGTEIFSYCLQESPVKSGGKPVYPKPIHQTRIDRWLNSPAEKPIVFLMQYEGK